MRDNMIGSVGVMRSASMIGEDGRLNLEMIVRVWRNIAPEKRGMSVHICRVGRIMGVRGRMLAGMRRDVRRGSMAWDMSRWEVWMEGDKVVCIARRHVLQWWWGGTIVRGICRGRDGVDLERA
jgi:hypothetical protein